MSREYDAEFNRRHAAGEQPERPRATGAPFSARYPDYCSGCDLAIDEGTLTVRMTDGTYRHARCGEGR